MGRTMERMTKTERRSELPQGFVVRPGTLEDLPAAVAIADRCDVEVVGQSTGFSRKFKISWTSPECELARDIRVLEGEDGTVAAFAHVMCDVPYARARTVAFVDPSFCGRGLGRHLVRWSEERAREKTDAAPEGARTSVQRWIIAGDERSRRLLCRMGYELRRHFVYMLTELDGEPEAPAWPAGVELRPVTWQEHGRLIAAADNEIFRDHWGFAPKSEEAQYEHMRHWIENDPELDEGLWYVAWEGDELAGLLLCWPKAEDNPEIGYLGILGVRRPWRGRGLGLALLRHSFFEFYRQGKKQAALHADAENLTGALRLYTKAGMRIHRRYEHYEKELRAGRELATMELE